MDNCNGIENWEAWPTLIPQNKIPERQDHHPEHQDRIEKYCGGLNPAMGLVLSPASEVKAEGEQCGDYQHQYQGHVRSKVCVGIEEPGLVQEFIQGSADPGKHFSRHDIDDARTADHSPH